MKGSSGKSSTGIQLATLGFVALALFLTIALAQFIAPGAALAFTPGENGHPTSGASTDLKGRGGDVTFAFQTNATLTCVGSTATSFTMKLDYSISGAPLPAGSVVVVYLSPNNGAINNNAGGNDAAYIAAVESNETTIPMAGLSGSGTLSFDVTVTTAFQLSGGGVLGVIANDADGVSSWNTKTNSLNCSEAQTATPTAPPTPTQIPTPTAPTTPTPTPAQSPTPTPTPTAAPTVGPSATPSISPSPTAVLTETETPAPGALPPSPTPTPAALAAALPPTGGSSVMGAGLSWVLVLGGLAVCAGIAAYVYASKRRGTSGR